MNIVSLPFEQPYYLQINGRNIEIIVFKTLEDGNIKFGINAPRDVQVHREEIYNAIKQKKI